MYFYNHKENNAVEEFITHYTPLLTDSVPWFISVRTSFNVFLLAMYTKYQLTTKIATFLVFRYPNCPATFKSIGIVFMKM